MASASIEGLEVITHPNAFARLTSPLPKIADTTALDEEFFPVLINKVLIDGVEAVK